MSTIHLFRCDACGLETGGEPAGEDGALEPPTGWTTVKINRTVPNPDYAPAVAARAARIERLVAVAGTTDPAQLAQVREMAEDQVPEVDEEPEEELEITVHLCLEHGSAILKLGELQEEALLPLHTERPTWAPADA